MTLASLKKTISILNSTLSDTVNPGTTSRTQYEVKTTNSAELVAGRWMNSCSLLVMPGGRDLPYVAQLHGTGNQHIRDFVKNGGSYLGICAGGYYGCSFVQFAKGNPQFEVIGSRELSFYPGIAEGPVFPNFSYTSHQGAMAAGVILTPAGTSLLTKTRIKDTPNTGGTCDSLVEKETSLSVFFNGGCHFVNHQSDITPQVGQFSSRENVCEVLATYNATPDQLGPTICPEDSTLPTDLSLAAVVLCAYGKGKALLTGVHIEASEDLLNDCYDGDDHIGSFLPHIARTNEYREAFFNSCVDYLLQ